jgi:hypothetical protein
VLDPDISKSALLAAAVPVAVAGHASYLVLDAMARHLLQQGHRLYQNSSLWAAPTDKSGNFGSEYLKLTRMFAFDS